MVLFSFTPDLPWLPWQQNRNKIWNKMGYNSACVRDICKTFASIRGFSGMGHWMLPIAFFPNRPHCHGNEIWDKIGYNSACVRDICKICASIRGFWWMGQQMLPIEFYPNWPSLQWEQNLKQNGPATTRHVRDISKILAPNKGFWGWSK